MLTQPEWETNLSYTLRREMYIIKVSLGFYLGPIKMFGQGICDRGKRLSECKVYFASRSADPV